MPAPDVVVIGGGIVGCSTALFLARAGARVTLVERAEQVGTEASGRNAGGIRASGRKLPEVPLALASITLWEGLRDEYGNPFEFDQHGQMYIARNAEEVESLRRAKPVLRQQGVDVRLVMEAELRELVPNLSPLIVAGLHSPRDGFANPILATRFIGRLAAQAGARILTGTAVTGLEQAGGRVTEVRTSRGKIPAGAVICTAGPWAGEISAMVGVSLPVVPRPTQAGVMTATRPVLRQFVSGHTVYIRPTRSGNLLLGGGSVDPLTGFSQASRLPAIRWSVQRAMEVLPAVRETSVLRTWTGTLAMSPDHMLILDAMPGVENMTLAAGFSGHGFCLGPIVGQLLSEMTLGLSISLPIDPLRLARFGPAAPAGAAG